MDAPRRTFNDAHWNEPLKWAKTAPKKLGRRPRVFCASMADVFDKDAPDGARERLWKLIEATPELDWLLLTKRIGNVPRMLPVDWGGGWANVWLGATIANQEEADRDIPKLLDTPAHYRFLSCEPLLGPIDLKQACSKYRWRDPDGTECCAMPRLLSWVISGGESGPKARPSHPDWHRSLRDQCAAAGVPFLFKQWGEWAPGECASGPPKRTERAVHWWGNSWTYVTLTPRASSETHRDDEPDLYRLGKKAAGRHLDGITHDGFPA